MPHASCLIALIRIAKSQGLPFPIPYLKFLDQCREMRKFLEAGIEEGTNALLSHCEAPLIENGVVAIDVYGEMLTLVGDAYKLIAEKAMKEKQLQWNKPPQLVLVCDWNGTVKWVKGPYRHLYRV
jgi:hypothetical protein